MHPAPGHLLAAIAALLATLAFVPARAQQHPDSLRTTVLQPAPLRTGSSPLAADQTAEEAPASFADTTLPASGWLGNSVRLEVPRDAATGEYARPKFVVGLPSDSMKGWMSAAGLDADHCMLPMLRARTRMSGDGEVSGTLWLFARCTFR